MQLKNARKSELSCLKEVFFLLLVIIYVPPIILNINAVVFDSVILLRFKKMVKSLPEYEYFYCILEK